MTFHHKNIESSNASVSNAFDSIFMQIRMNDQKKAKPDLCTPPQISSNMRQSPAKQDAMKIQQNPDAEEEVVFNLLDCVAAEEAPHQFVVVENIRRS